MKPLNVCHTVTSYIQLTQFKGLKLMIALITF